MPKIRLMFLICLAAFLVACTTEASTEIPATVTTESESLLSCQNLLETTMQSMETACAGLGRNQVCYGNRLINVALLDAASDDFDTVGDRMPLQNVERISLSPYNAETGDWGFALLQAQANLPDTLPGQNVTFLLFGGTEFSPQGEVDGIQAFYVRTGIGEISACNDVPEEGLYVQSPEGDVTVQFRLNDVLFELGSTAYITADAGTTMDIYLLEGQSRVTAAGESQVIATGQVSRVPLNEEGFANAAPSEATNFENPQLRRTIRIPRIEAPRQLATVESRTNTVSINEAFASLENPDAGQYKGEVAAGEEDIYEFEAQAGQVIFFDSLSTATQSYWSLLAPDGRELYELYWAGGDELLAPFEESGRYQLILRGLGDRAGGDYDFQIWNVLPVTGQDIVISEAIAGNEEGLVQGRIETPGNYDLYRFHANAGQQVFFDGVQVEGNIYWTLTAPNGEILFDTNYLGGDVATMKLEEGDYVLRIAGIDGVVGNYEFQLWDVPVSEIVSLELALGEETIVAGDISTPGVIALYSFFAEKGMSIRMGFAATGDYYLLNWSLTAPDGTVLVDSLSAVQEAQTLELELSGEYRLEVQSDYDATTDFEMVLELRQ